jgi:hypothetical protein
MKLNLTPDVQRFVDRKLEEGRSLDELIEAGLTSLEQQERTADDFAPGELERLLAVGEADEAKGDLYDGESVFREIEALSAARRREEGR